MADETFSSEALIEISLSIKFLFSAYPSLPRDTTLDQVFYCNYTDVHGNADAGIPVVTVSLEGIWLNKLFAGLNDEAVITIPVTLGSSAYAEGVHITEDTVIDITFTVVPDHTDVVFEALKSNWVAWSNIGEMDFTIDHDNVAGERPMDWKGYCRGLKQLGSRVVAYGKNGVSFLNPSGNTYGLKTIYRVGTKAKNAFTGNDDVHYFIDNKSQLFKLTDGLEKLDYSEYLTVLGVNTVMSYDPEEDLVYICDGTYGFVFSPADESLGKGPVNISGLGVQDGTLYPVAPATIATPLFEICTDIYDLGSRNSKTIQSVEFGIDANTTNQILYGAIDHRRNVQDAFASTDWKIVHESGVLWQTAHGREFRFKFKLALYEYVEIDYLRIKGVMHEN